MHSKSGAVHCSPTSPSLLLSTLCLSTPPSTYKQAWAEDIVSALPLSALGFVPRTDIFLLKVCFAAADAQQDFINSPFVCKHFTAHPLPPAGTPPIFILIKLVNVPVLSLIVIEQSIHSFWSSYG